jgi:hypothetical protein
MPGVRLSPAVFALVLALALLTAPLARAAPNTEAEKNAQRLLVEGRALFKAGQYPAALERFRQSYRDWPSVKAEINIALTLSNLHEDYQAMVALEHALGVPGVFVDERARLEEQLAAWRTRVARLSIEVNVAGAELALDGRTVGSAPLLTPLYLGPGEHHVRASKTGHVATESLVKVAHGDRGEIKLQIELAKEPSAAPPPAAAPSLPPAAPVAAVAAGPNALVVVPPTPRSGLRIATLTTAGLGVGGVATGTVFGLMARSGWQAARQSCPMRPCGDPQAIARGVDAGNDADRATTAFVAGGAALGAALALWWLDR